jgi:hypothetical protein
MASGLAESPALRFWEQQVHARTFVQGVHVCAALAKSPGMVYASEIPRQALDVMLFEFAGMAQDAVATALQWKGEHCRVLVLP